MTTVARKAGGLVEAVETELPIPYPLIADADDSEAVSTEFALHSTMSPHRGQLEAFIARKFNVAFGAAIVEFFPLLLSRTEEGNLASVVGLRPGTERPLFLEQYLDQPLESTLEAHTAAPVARRDLMEIGNLASESRTGNQLTFILLTAVLARAGYSWVVFTATSQVRKLLGRLDFEPLTLCEAQACRLTNKSQRWGSYYQSQPQVQAGNLALGMSILQANPDCARLLVRHEAEIARLASLLRAIRLQRG